MEGFEFRPATADEMPALRRLGRYVFAANPSEEEDEPDMLRPEWTHAAFHRGQPVACSAGFPFKVRLNGRGVPADGVTAVGTDPGYRRRGLVRRLIGDLLRRAHENGQPVSILWASMGAIYQRFGYGPASTQVEYSFDPRFAGFQFGEAANGYTRLVESEAAVPVISGLYRRFIEPRNLLLHRAPVQWQLPFRDKKRKTHCAIHYAADDEADGYMLYTVSPLDEPSGDAELEQQLAITDFVWRNMNGYRGLWEFVRAHDLVVKVTTYFAAEDDPATSLLLEPRILERRTADGIWLRVVDAAAALAARGYDHAGETTVRIAEDAECPWNVGVHRLVTDGVQAEVRPAAKAGQAEITVTPHGLASLLAGHSPLSHLARVGRALVADNKRLPRLDALFATRYRPHCMNEF